MARLQWVSISGTMITSLFFRTFCLVKIKLKAVRIIDSCAEHISCGPEIDLSKRAIHHPAYKRESNRIQRTLMMMIKLDLKITR